MCKTYKDLYNEIEDHIGRLPRSYSYINIDYEEIVEKCNKIKLDIENYIDYLSKYDLESKCFESNKVGYAINCIKGHLFTIEKLLDLLNSEKCFIDLSLIEQLVMIDKCINHEYKDLSFDMYKFLDYSKTDKSEKSNNIKFSDVPVGSDFVIQRGGQYRRYYKTSNGRPYPMEPWNHKTDIDDNTIIHKIIGSFDFVSGEYII